MNKNITTLKRLIKNTKNFLTIKYYGLFYKIQNKQNIFYGWGKKESGLKAISLAKKQNSSFVLLEDGFIRSMDLGIKGSPSFSLVEDKKGIYYDATSESDLENILNSYDFNADKLLLKKAKEAIELIENYHISKYNNAPNISDDFFKDEGKKRILIIAQTAGDASLEYGLGNKFTTKQMIDEAMNENLNASIYLKIHPDVLVGKKESDILLSEIPKECIVLDEDVNSISLLKNFSKVYTKTSGMGMEALILGLEVVCYGLPYYAGWGLTLDKQSCARRTRELNMEELFAGAYILYTRYYNPYRKRPSDIIDVINEIVLQKKKAKHEKIYDALALGDSHIRVFEYRLLSKIALGKDIKTLYIAGATARGIKNLNSQTQSQNRFLVALEEYNYNKIIITLGEVDTAYIIWERAEKTGVLVEKMLNESVENYYNFLLKLQNYAPVIILSAPLPTLKDKQECNDTVHAIRRTVKASQKERTQLTLAFNQAIKERCKAHEDLQFIDLDSSSLNKESLVSSWLLDPKNRCNHHYCRKSYGLLLAWKLKNVI